MGQADSREQRGAQRAGFVGPRASDVDGRLDDVLQCRHVRKQVEPLEEHADLLALAGDVPLAILDELAALLAVADEVAVHEDAARLDLLQVMDAA